MDVQSPAAFMFDSGEEEEEEELSVLEYARQNGLSTPFYSETLFIGGLPSPPRDNFDQDSRGLSNALTTNQTSALIKECLTVNRDAAQLLKVVHEFREPLQYDELTAKPRQFARHARQELPVLRTDNELDMICFGKASTPDLTKLNIPSEIINEENDEGFKWPRKYYRYPKQGDEQIKAEKLAIPRDVLLHLQNAIRDNFDAEDWEILKSESVRYKPVSKLRGVQEPH